MDQIQEKGGKIKDSYIKSGVYINKPKYKHIKDEFIYSGVEDCDVYEWNQCVLLKSIKYAMTPIVKYIKSANRDNELHYNIPRGTPLSLSNLQAIIMWCDFPLLQQLFLSTFSAEFIGEPMPSIINRHKRFYNLAKILRETVQYFGHNRYTERGPFYAPIGTVYEIPSFSITINKPLFTSKDIDIAWGNSGSGGIIIQLENDGDYESRNHLRCFDCSWISRYVEENERLFFEPGYSLRIATIIHRESANNYELFFSSFYLLDCMLNGTNMEGAIINVSENDIMIINDLIEKNTKRYDLYAIDTFRSFCLSKTEISININILDWYFNAAHGIIMNAIKEDDDKNNKKKEKNVNLFKNEIPELFTNLKYITIITTSNDGSDSYSISLNALLTIINLLSNKYLTTITIKASWDKDNVHRYTNNRSWVFNLWNKQSVSIENEFNDSGWDISLKRPTDINEDWLIIEKQNNPEAHKQSMKNMQPEMDGMRTLKVHKERCTIVHDDGGIIKNCDYLSRLKSALNQYTKLPQHKLVEFFQTEYAGDFLNDYHHLIKNHKDQLPNIYMELIDIYDFTECNGKNCQMRARHNNRRQYGNSDRYQQMEDNKNSDLEINFYRQQLDSLHFFVFHVLNKRVIESQNNEYTEHEDDDQKVTDKQIKTMNNNTTNNDDDMEEKTVNDGNNKFSLQIVGNDQSFVSFLVVIKNI